MIQNFLPYEKRPIEDRFVVPQTGYVDLRFAFQNMSVAPDMKVSEDSFNGVGDPSLIIGRPDDVFAAKRAEKVYKSVATATAPDLGGHPAGEEES